MKRNLILTIAIFTITALIGYSAWLYHRYLPEITIKKVAFSKLPDWQNSHIKQSFDTFKISCRTLLKLDPKKFVGSASIDLKAEDWHPACKAALSLEKEDNKTIRYFFESFFAPVTFYQHKQIRGLFTGYYLPELAGSLTKTDEFNVPLYSTPKHLITVDLGLFDQQLKFHRKLVGRLVGNKLLPFYTRQEINNGALVNEGHAIAWIKSEVDRQFLEIEGSGVIKLGDGSEMYVGYDAENGAPYVSIAKILIDMGAMTADNASMQHIRQFFKSHPEKVDAVLNQNKSFVFFAPQSAAMGAQGVALTPGYSLAVDRKWIPLGAPIWLMTTIPHRNSGQHTQFNRLMIAQDTGGAIRGPVRGDVYWGAGASATYIAGHMKNNGFYWLLLPKEAVNHLKNIGS
ncbi:MAG: murein transglycosylase A [Legionella sp.]